MLCHMLPLNMASLGPWASHKCPTKARTLPPPMRRVVSSGSAAFLRCALAQKATRGLCFRFFFALAGCGARKGAVLLQGIADFSPTLSSFQPFRLRGAILPLWKRHVVHVIYPRTRPSKLQGGLTILFRSDSTRCGMPQRTQIVGLSVVTMRCTDFAAFSHEGATRHQEVELADRMCWSAPWGNPSGRESRVVCRVRPLRTQGLRLAGIFS